MKLSIDKKLGWVYLWMGLAYSTLWMLSNHSNFSGTFWQGVGNNVWRIVYVIVLNYIFLEYTVPFVIRKKRYIIYNILLAIPALWVHCLFWSYGLYGWRLLGMQLHIYTGTAAYKTLNDGLTAQMAYSVGSVFFFGIIRHVYNYVKLKQAAQQLRIEKQSAELNYL
ncbi:MAG TPA: hypothetical protein VKB95_13545, partial [Chitinophagaceae bacterium]|nr:hypothetical protein [Chitinophagaceae bacterium]